MTEMKHISEVIKNMPVKLSADQRRNIIATAAVRVFESDGIIGVTHSEVAKRCHIQTSAITVRKYYPTKAELWALVQENDESGEAAKQIKALGG